MSHPPQPSAAAPLALPQKPAMSFSEVVRPRNIAEAMAFCERISRSSLLPKAMQGDPIMVMALIEFGERAGMSVFESLQNVAFINGKICVYGDKMLAMVLASGKLANNGFSEVAIRDPRTEAVIGYTCRVVREGQEPLEQTFTVEHAKKARLWGKPGPWTDYPERMLQMRARSFALRDRFADVLAGMHMVEEVLDYAKDATTGQMVAKPKEGEVIDASAASKQSSDPDPLAELLSAIDAAQTPEQLAAASELGKKASRDVAVQARAAFAAKQRELAVQPKPQSKADLILAEIQRQDATRQEEDSDE